MRTSSTALASRVPCSRTAWQRSTLPTSTSRLPTSRRWSRSHLRSWKARGMPLSLRWGHVTAVRERLDGLVRLEVDGTPCIAYPRLTGPVEEGDTVIINTQARDLELGSGGF